MPHRFEVQMRWSDIDSLGHGNNAKIVTYLEEARIRFLQEKLNWDWNVDGVILARIEVDYRQPLFYPSEIVVDSGISKLGNSSVTMRHKVIRLQDQGIIAEAVVVLVVYDSQSKSPKAIRPELREQLEQFLLEPIS